MVRFTLCRHGEPLVEGSLADVAAALGLSVSAVSKRAASGTVDADGYVVERFPPKPRKEPEEPEEPHAPWSPGTSPTLRMLRKRREEYDWYEPRWER